MRRETGINDDVLLPRVLVYGNAADDPEAVAVVDIVGDGAECGVQAREREGFLGDISQWSLKA
jgi:hypothetical protein